MNLKAPAKSVLLISLVLAALAVLGKFVDVPVLSEAAFWFAFFAWLVLGLGTLFK